MTMKLIIELSDDATIFDATLMKKVIEGLNNENMFKGKIQSIQLS